MLCFDLTKFTQFLLESWSGLSNFLNSPFISAFFAPLVAALAGAYFGARVARDMAERESQTKGLLESLEQANAMIVLSVAIANQALTLKKQQVKPQSDQYFKDREAAVKWAKAKVISSSLQMPRHELQMIKMPSITFPIDGLKNLIFAKPLIPGFELALVLELEQFAEQLGQAINMKTALIDGFYQIRSERETIYRKYYGLPQVDGQTDEMYLCTMTSLSEHIDNVVFFSITLSEGLQEHAAKTRAKLLKFRRDVPKAFTADFAKARAEGLVPPESDYQNWLSGFNT